MSHDAIAICVSLILSAGIIAEAISHATGRIMRAIVTTNPQVGL